MTANPELETGLNDRPIANATRDELFLVTKYLPPRSSLLVQSYVFKLPDKYHGL